MSIQFCTVASNEELSQEFIDPWDVALCRLEESNQSIINSNQAIIEGLAKLKDKLSTPTPPPVSRFDTLGSSSGLNVSKQVSSKHTKSKLLSGLSL
ncbi:hypothetical protein RHMOL_Rhmol11G0112500 [Rhododendron molle]|uniref:Uncharacterized protein n=1 Tax=Rhododendron molle TaxID=49168 RepID=A0ACC0LR62_RHOML|nr:hypothetical protein RHMOL_Rhmol11G0112500 [Rhododendron molle]